MRHRETLPTGGLTSDLVRDLNLRPEGRLLSVLSTHGERERDALDTYRELVAQADDEGVRYLGNLIIEDEERHHEMISEMLNSIRSFVEDVAIEPRIPSSVYRVSDDLLSVAERLLDFEKGDLAELEALKEDLRDDGSYPLLELLVDLIVGDTRKHIAVLEFIRARARA